MTKVLSIDTSSAHCSVALQLGTELIERVSEAERQSAQRVLPMISELLQEAGIELNDLGLIAVVAGPGSFTGVRIGIAVAQGLSLSCAVTVVPLSSLALTAMACLADTSADNVLVSEEAREGEVYFAAYRRSLESGVELIGREQVAQIIDLDVLPSEFRDQAWSLAGDGWGRKDEILQRLGCIAAGELHSSLITNSHIVELGKLRLSCGEAVSAAALRPNYVKEQLDYN